MAHMVVINDKGGSVCFIIDTSWTWSIDLMSSVWQNYLRKRIPQMHEDYRAIRESDAYFMFVQWMNEKWIGSD